MLFKTKAEGIFKATLLRKVLIQILKLKTDRIWQISPRELVMNVICERWKIMASSRNQILHRPNNKSRKRPNNKSRKRPNNKSRKRPNNKSRKIRLTQL